MLKRYSTLFALILVFVLNTFAQEAAKPEPIPDGWRRGAGLGIDFAALSQFNPKVGAGDDRLGLGGNLTYFANYKKGRFAWDNLTGLILGAQKLGKGLLPGQTNNIKVPWQKSADELRLDSKAGYKFSENSKFFYAGNLIFVSQLLKSYGDNTNYWQSKVTNLSVVKITNSKLQKLMSPALVTFPLGVDYKPTQKLSIYYSPVALKWNIVLDDEIARREAIDKDGNGLGASVFGNKWKRNADGSVTFGNVQTGFGSLLKIGYDDKFLNERVTYSSRLNLFTDYFNNPFTEIDVDWANSFAFNIYKGLQLGVNANVFYDDDVFVQVTDNDAPGGIRGLGKRTSVITQFLVKYNVVF